VGGVLPARELGQIALADADREELVLLALLLPDAAQITLLYAL
jgi:hypothetical protein